jgi:methionyl-tRNA synthetase
VSRSFYVTTPIYYPNAAPHLGSAYTTIYADMLARYHRALGDETWFLTGVDEHGEKIEQAARARGESPQAFVDRVAAQFRDTWSHLGLTPHRFIRTTDRDHVRAVQHFWRVLHERGEIEFREYTGLYCVGCEAFYTERELQDGVCPQHRVAPEPRSESNYFFRMSRHFDWLAQELDRNPGLVSPERYRNEALGMLRDGGLEDLCISRPRARLEWGIPLPFDDRYVTYVWVDALVNYLTGIGYPDDPAWEGRWSGVHHLTAKDILKPHAIFWPTMLHAAGLPLYQGLHVHGYWNLGGQKMSKSLGNLVDALALERKYGVEALRYYLLREMSFGLDAEVSEEALVRRLNAELANDLGNLVHRSLSMLQRYFDGIVPEPSGASELGALAERVSAEVNEQLAAFSSSRALAALWELVGGANKYVDSSAPWKLAKRPEDRPALATALYECLEAVRVIAHLLEPFLPGTSARTLGLLGVDVLRPLDRAVAWGGLAPGTRTRAPEALFPRIETS